MQQEQQEPQANSMKQTPTATVQVQSLNGVRVMSTASFLVLMEILRMYIQRSTLLLFP